MSYLGDADLGDDTNVGAGTITANFDGRQKHRTTIGERVFLGVDTMLRRARHDRRRREDRRRRGRHEGRAAGQARGRRAGPDPRAAAARRRAGAEPPTPATDAAEPPAPRRRTDGTPRRGPLVLDILVIVLLTLLEGFFVAAEIALVSIRRSRVEQLVEEGNAGARRVRRLLEDPGRFLAVSQLGLTVIGFFASAYAAVNLAGALTTVLTGARGRRGHRRRPRPGRSSRSSSPCSRSSSRELVPKTLALANPERFALAPVASRSTSSPASSAR